MCFLFCCPYLDASNFGQVCVVAWAVWNDRNLMVNDGKACLPPLVVDRAIAMLEEFKNSKLSLLSPPPSIVAILGADWLGPPPDQLKLNSAVVMRKGY
jgi:hypothetical protein